MILWLRGPSGSGKSFVGHRLVDEHPTREVLWPAGVWPNKNRTKKRLVGYELPGDLFVVGGYVATCGGLDGLGGSVLRIQIPFVERAAAKYRHVFAESLMATFIVPERFLEMRARLRPESLPLVLPGMGTTAEQCRANILHRNGGKPFNEDVTITWNQQRATEIHARTVAAGIDAPLLDQGSAYEECVRILREGGWRP